MDYVCDICFNERDTRLHPAPRLALFALLSIGVITTNKTEEV